jgi:Fe-S cluster biogenesis protein NfuA/nitrite reductase/ring-hydroxylating ferredoxin subunit
MEHADSHDAARVSGSPTVRHDLAGLVRDVESLEAIFATWDADRRGAVAAYRRAIEALHGEALARMIRALKAHPAALVAMKEAAGDEVIYAVLRRHGLIRPSLNERIEGALESIRPVLAAHGGDVRVIRVEPPAVEVSLVGACDGCASSALTFQAGIRKAIQDACPEITEVVHVRGQPSGENARFASPFATSAGGAWLPACAVDEIPDGGARFVAIANEQVLLYRSGAVVTCFQDACAHLGRSLETGAIDAGVITCPHHGFRYDLANGECLGNAQIRLRARAVRIVSGRVEVRRAT